jgi:25S rRNA (cytosine2278-C5)-methyltransferase
MPTTELALRKGFAKDPHVPNLLSFSPQNTFSNDVLIKDGKFILQDKASCFPAFILSPPADDEAVVIDATSAPGNKTTHLSALMEGKGKVRKALISQ